MRSVSNQGLYGKDPGAALSGRFDWAAHMPSRTGAGTALLPILAFSGVSFVGPFSSTSRYLARSSIGSSSRRCASSAGGPSPTGSRSGRAPHSPSTRLPPSSVSPQIPWQCRSTAHSPPRNRLSGCSARLSRGQRDRDLAIANIRRRGPWFALPVALARARARLGRWASD
jgi:hypothetical protein